jgi:DNA-binding response OmpR family regulator
MVADEKIFPINSRVGKVILRSFFPFPAPYQNQEGADMFKTEILLVDDAKIFLDIQKNFLRYSPVQISTAYNGIEALKTARQKRPDLVVMDVGMPHLDGVACCKAIKEDPALSSTPVILVSTNSGHDDIVAYQNAGCCAILHKPLQRREFLNRLYAFLPVIERREPRVPCTIPVTVETETGTFAGTCHDIAMNGLYVATDHDMKSACEIVLSFRLPNWDNTVTVARGRIAWHNSAKENANTGLPNGFGVEFLEIIGEDGVIARHNHLMEFLMAHKAF